MSHFETSDSKWLWGIKVLIIFLNYGVWWLQEVWAFEFHQPVLKKVTWDGLNSLQQRGCKYQCNLDFWWSNSLEGTNIGHLSTRDNQTIRISNYLTKWGYRGHWGHGGCWGCRGHWDHRGSKAWKITTEHFRVIQVMNLS